MGVVKVHPNLSSLPKGIPLKLDGGRPHTPPGAKAAEPLSSTAKCYAGNVIQEKEANNNIINSLSMKKTNHFNYVVTFRSECSGTGYYCDEKW